MLGRARSRAGLVALLGGVRALRGRPMSTDQRYRTLAGLFGGLVRAAAPAVVPTLLLDVGDGDGLPRYRLDALAVLARLAPLRVAPVLRALAEAGEAVFDLIPALAAAGEIEALTALCQYPVEGERQQAAARLRELGHEPPEMSPLPPSEALVTHRSREVRGRALRELAEREDPALVLSFFAAFHLDRAIRRPYEDSWTSYKVLDAIPRPLQRAPAAAQLRWLREEGAAGRPAQVIWPAIEPVLDGDIEALAAALSATVAAVRGRHGGAARGRGGRGDRGARGRRRGAGGAGRRGRAGGGGAAPAVVTAPVVEVAPRQRRRSRRRCCGAGAGYRATTTRCIDELLTCLVREEQPSPQLIRTRPARQRDRVPGSLRSRARAAGRAAGARGRGRRPARDRAPDRAARGLGDAHVAEQVLPAAAAADPALAVRLGELFDEAHTLPWAWPSRVADLLASVASMP